MVRKICLLLIASIFIILLTNSIANCEPYPKVKAWASLPNQTAVMRIQGDPVNEKRVYTVKCIARCRGNEQGWVLKTIDGDHPYCYLIGEQIAVIRDGMFTPFIKKTYKEK